MPMSDVTHARPKIIGARVKRTEDPRLLTGRGSFVDDRQFPNVLHVAFRRSEHAHARIVSIDCAAARAAPGVIAVFTANDLAVKPLVATSRMKGYYATPILPLARGKVRFVGEPVVGVIAENRYLAEDAAELIEMEFAPLAHAADPAGTRLLVVAPDVGGGFGGKGSLYPEEIFVCAAARKLGRAVKWTSDRMEDLAATSHGFDEIVEAELGLDHDGRMLALRADAIGDVGAYSIYPWTAALEPVQVVSFLPGPYRIDAYRGRVQAVATAKAPTGPYRGVGRPISTFVMERLVDMAAAKLKLDPKELRARNLVRRQEFPYKVASGIVWDRSGLIQCLDAACNAIGYDALRAQQKESRAAGQWFGIGIASYAELTGIGSRISVAPGMPLNTGTETAKIRIDTTGGVTAAFGVASHGQGLETTLAQVVADKLGVRIEDIRV